MKPILPLLTAAIVTLLLPAMTCRAQEHAILVDPLPELLMKMQGTWEGTETGREGKCRLTVKGSTLHFQGADKREWYKAIALVNAAADPVQLDGKITDCSVPEVVGKTAPAIVKIEDSTLTIVGHAPGAADAPKSFAGDPDSRTLVFKKAE